MTREEIVEYCTRCQLLGEPCILDNYYEIELLNGCISLKYFDFISVLNDYPDDVYIKFPSYIESISSFAIESKVYNIDKCIHLDLNQVKHLYDYAFNACTNLRSIIGEEVCVMEENSIVVYTNTHLHLSFNKMKFNSLGILPIAVGGSTIVTIKSMDKEEVYYGIEALNI